jgi:hypothetical protein
MASSIASFLEATLLAGALCACAAAATPSKIPDTPMTTHTIEAAEAEVTNANGFAAQHDWVSANVCLRRGLATLGDDYVPDGVIDETGTRLVLADAKEREGDLATAVTLRQRVLANRLALARTKLAQRP